MKTCNLALRCAVLALASLAGTSCRGGVSKKPPVHPVLDMDFQPKFRAQSDSEFWKDGMAMRVPPAGTVARGSIKEGKLYEFGAGPDKWVTESPIKADLQVLARGQQLFNVHCAPCHDRTGSGQGLVAKRWPLPVPSFYADDRADLPVGRIVGAITNGFGTMPSYAHQVEWNDRWAVALYVRALQYRMKAN